ncbi:MAG TPA: hypothetical protein EYP21_06980 [Syntrophaceae bacterium]|nr:hypothetical protein [Syntrophaceae bacterium]
MIKFPAWINEYIDWISDKLFMGLTIKEYMKRLLTPFNIIAGLIVFVGLYFLIQRYTQGLVAVTEASNELPWGLFLGIGLFTQVPYSSVGFVLGTAVYIFGLKKYHPVLKNAILLGFLGYFFAVVFILIDIGRPWRIYYPMVISFGTNSVLFLVAWHVALYNLVQALELAPPAFEWLGFKTLRRWAKIITLALVISGIMLSTLHQSALGAMFLLTPGKLHPLWYTSFLPWLFFVSCIPAGLAYLIVVSKLTQIFLKDKADSHYLKSLDNISLGLGKASALILITYVGLRLYSVAQENVWQYLNTPYGHWFFVEFSLFAILPFLFYYGVQRKNVGFVQLTALLTIFTIALNRVNTTLIAFNWQLPHHIYWKEGVVLIAVLTIQLLIYRWVVNRMPILREHPDYISEVHLPSAGTSVASKGS